MKDHKRYLSRNLPPVFSALLLSAGLLAAMSLPSTASVVAHFEHGGSLSSPVTSFADAYPGKSDVLLGWVDDWRYRGYASPDTAENREAAVTSIGVTTDARFSSGRKLSMVPSNNATGIGMLVSRQYGATEEVDLDQKLTISFGITIDSLGKFLDSSSNSISVAENSSRSEGLNTNGRWMVHAFGGTDPDATVTGAGSSVYNNAKQRQWNVYNGNGLGTNTTTTFIPTGILLVEGAYYFFEITIDPSTFTYTVKIENGPNSFTSDTLRFRNDLPLGGFLNFGERYAISEGAAFSFGDLSITAVPEPSSLALFVFGLGGLVWLGIYRKGSITPPYRHEGPFK